MPLEKEFASEKKCRSAAPSPLQSEFPVPDLNEWRSLVEKQLQGAPFEKKLVSRTPEGIAVQPLYVSNGAGAAAGFPGFEPFVRGTAPLSNHLSGWIVCQSVAAADPARAAAVIAEELGSGANGIRLIIDRASQSGRDPHEAPEQVGQEGVSIFTRSDLESIISVLPQAAELVIEAGEATVPILVYLKNCGAARPITVVFDPIARALTSGSLRAEPTRQIELIAPFLESDASSTGLKALGIDGRPYGDAGGSAVEELAFSFASLIDYVRMLPGLGPKQLLQQVSFHFSAGPRLFMEIAKFRAARLLWAQLLKCYEIPAGGDSPRPRIHACSQLWSKTTIDPYVNLLRVTTEAFGAAIGGAESITTAPFDCAIGEPDDLARRIARNTQLILLEESHLHRVIDAGGGSWYIEWLTRELAQTSWTLLQQVEGLGGMSAAVSIGWVQERIASTQKQRLAEIAQRREIMVGTNQYADVNEKPVIREGGSSRLQFQAGQIEKSIKHSAEPNPSLPPFTTADEICSPALKLSVGRMLNYMLGSDSKSYSIRPLNIRRAAADYEVLRQRTEEFELQKGALPAVLLLGFGPVAQHKARADFSREFLEPAGYAVTLRSGLSDPVQAAKAAADSNADFVVLCSTDETYPELVPAFCAAYRQLTNDGLIILAGYPADSLEQFKSAGVQEFIHLRANNLETLNRFHAFLGV